MNATDAYKAGWAASKRTTTYDLEAAEDRFVRKHGSTHHDDFVRGWTDYAADAPYQPSLTHTEVTCGS